VGHGPYCSSLRQRAVATWALPSAGDERCWAPELELRPRLKALIGLLP
jgi:hypothetical protein